MAFKIIAKIVSFLFHPLLIGTYISISIGLFRTEMIIPFTKDSLSYFIIFMLVSTFFIPSLLLLIFHLIGLGESIYWESKQDRIIAGIFILILESLLCIILILNNLSSYHIFNLLLINVIVLAIGTLLTSLIKISLHALGAGVLVVYLGFVAYSANDFAAIQLFLLSIISAGAICSSRMYLQKHTMQEIIIGLVAGMITCTSCVFYFGY